MDNLVIPFWFLALLPSPCCAAPFSETLTVSVKSPVSVQKGHVATLPCWLTSSQSAEDMEVRWYQGGAQKETSILLYKAKGVDYTSQKASYTDRVSFGLKDGTSSGLKTGDISLKLQNVTLEDTGKYTCFVSSLADYDSASVSLIVTETGRPPLLSAVMKDDDQVNVSCESEGWHPKPELRWSDRTEALTSADVSFSKTSAGLYTVRSWLLVPSSSEVSCAVGFASEVPKEARIHLKYSPSLPEESGSSSAGWVAFGLLLAAVLAASGALYFLYFRRKANKPRNDTTDGAQLMNSPDEIEPLLSKGRYIVV
ncbi:butyrophilin subfamily 3 member A3-like [Fundulus diaphanus]